MPRFGFNYEPRLFRSRRQSLLVDNQSSAAFSPGDLPNLALWLDADDASTLTLSGSVVDEWRDKSGNGRNFTGSGSGRPSLVTSAYNGRDAIQFDGVNDKLTLTGAGLTDLTRNVSAVTMYAQYRWTTAGVANQAIITITGWGFSARPLLARAGSGKFQAQINRGFVNNVNRSALSSAISGTDWVTHTGYFDTGSNDVRQYLDGSLDGSSTSGTAGATDDLAATSAEIGNYPTVSYFAAAEITEILVYHAAHDATARAQVEAYLTR